MGIYLRLSIGVLITTALGVLPTTVFANDWYESMESSSMDYAVYQNVSPAANEGQAKPVENLPTDTSAQLLVRDVINSEVQKEIALQAFKETQAASVVVASFPGFVGKGGGRDPVNIAQGGASGFDEPG